MIATRTAALAAFFEEEGQVTGLVDTISEAAEWDGQVSKGKVLSNTPHYGGQPDVVLWVR